MQKNTTQNEEKNQSIKTDPEITQMTEDRDNKAVTMAVFQCSRNLLLSRDMNDIKRFKLNYYR